MAKQGILALWRKVYKHPDFVGGTIWIREDVADAIHRAEQKPLNTWDDEFIFWGDLPTNERVRRMAAVTPEQMKVANDVTRHYIDRDYSWFEAIEDWGLPGVEVRE